MSSDFVADNLKYVIYTFIICWYPLFIMLGVVRVMKARFIYSARYSNGLNKYSVTFLSTKGLKHSYTVEYEKYTFLMTRKGKLIRYFDSDDYMTRSSKKLGLFMLYVALILCVGLVGSLIKSHYNYIYFVRAFIYVSLAYFVGISTMLIVTKPLEFYARQCVEREYGLGIDE